MIINLRIEYLGEHMLLELFEDDAMLVQDSDITWGKGRSLSNAERYLPLHFSRYQNLSSDSNLYFHLRPGGVVDVKILGNIKTMSVFSIHET